MNATWNFIRRIGCGLALTVALAAAQPVCAKMPVVGQPAPDFHLTTLDGKRVSLADLKGQVIVLNFWATWCGPCKVELPLLDQYYAIQQKFGLSVFAVTTEDSAPLSALKPLAAAMHIPLVRSFHGPYDDLGAVPTNFVIDRAGVVRYAKAAAFTLDDLNDILVPLLKEQPPATLTPAATVPASADGLELTR